MVRRHFGHLLSLAAAAVSFGGHLAISTQPAVAARPPAAVTSCFQGVDFAALSIDHLTGLVRKAVSDLQGMGKNEREVVATIGAWMAQDAHRCSMSQVNALAKNVTAILVADGYPLTADEIFALLRAFFVKQPGAVAEEVETKFPTVYGLG